MKDKKILKEGPAKYSYPSKIEGPEKLMDYSLEGPPQRKPNRVKLKIDFNEDRFPPEAKVENFRKYDEQGNYKRKYQPKRKDSPVSVNPGSYALMKSSSLSNPYRSSNRVPRARKGK